MVRHCRESMVDRGSPGTTHQHYSYGLRSSVRPGALSSSSSLLFYIVADFLSSLKTNSTSVRRNQNDWIFSVEMRFNCVLCLCLSPKSIMLAGPRPLRLASEQVVSFSPKSTMLAKSEDLFACMNLIDLTWAVWPDLLCTWIWLTNGSFCTALIKFSLLTLMSIEFCSIFKTDNE